jgi:hypothetical protein
MSSAGRAIGVVHLVDSNPEKKRRSLCTPRKNKFFRSGTLREVNPTTF